MRPSRIFILGSCLGWIIAFTTILSSDNPSAMRGFVLSSLVFFGVFNLVWFFWDYSKIIDKQEVNVTFCLAGGRYTLTQHIVDGLGRDHVLRMTMDERTACRLRDEIDQIVRLTKTVDDGHTFEWDDVRFTLTDDDLNALRTSEEDE